jgi:hypothetical protein
VNEKEKAAREAAAKYSSNLALAVFEYGVLSRQHSSITSDSGRAKLQDEILRLLPCYRRPTSDEFAEWFLFFDPDGINLSASGYQIPIFVELLEKEGISENLLTGIKEYVRESELRKIELAQCKSELGELKKKFSDAQRIYNENKDKRSDERNALTVQAIGFSTGHAPKRIDKDRMWVDYVTLVRKRGMHRSDAVKAIKEKHQFNSENAASKALHEQRRSLLKRIEKQHPRCYPEAKRTLWGIVPRK